MRLEIAQGENTQREREKKRGGGPQIQEKHSQEESENVKRQCSYKNKNVFCNIKQET